MNIHTYSKSITIALVMAGFIVCAQPAPSKVARISLGTMAKLSPLIVIARVDGVKSYNGLHIARATPIRTLKGLADSGSIHFVASPTWACDTSEAVRNETVLLFLSPAKSQKVGRKMISLSPVMVPDKPLYYITHSGRGRMPVIDIEGVEHLRVDAGDISLPKALRTRPIPGEKYDWYRAVKLSDLSDAVAPPVAADIHASPLSCSIQANATCALGQAPGIKVEIKNLTDKEILLVGSLDASAIKWRYPHAYFEVMGPDGKSSVKPVTMCKTLNPLREKDFVKVPAGAAFDPYQSVDEYGFFPSFQLMPSSFDQPGAYKVRFTYSTDKADIQAWRSQKGLAIEEPKIDTLKALLARVPKTTVTSEWITVQVVKAATQR